MKRLYPQTFRSRDDTTALQIHEDEPGKPAPKGRSPSSVAPSLLYLTANHTIAVDRDQRIGPVLAAKLAVAELLVGMVAFDTEWKPLVAGVRQVGPRIEVGRKGSISIDWPESGVDGDPSPKFTVRGAEDDFVFDPRGLSGADFVEGSADVHGPGTVLLHRHDVTGTVIVSTVCGTASSRNALQLALTDRFAIEPRDLRTGRRIALKCYYDEIVRINLARNPFGFEADQTGERAKANEYPLLCYLEVDLADVILVSSPGTWKTVPRPTMP